MMCDSTRTNSHGFRINLSGMDLSRFNSNPVMLYRHNAEDVIGRWENLRVEDGKLIGEPVFDIEDDTAKKVAGRVERGFLRGCSVGIIVSDMRDVGGEWVATKTELMEASICSIPSDAGAVRLYDANRKELSFEEVRLQFNNNNKNVVMDEKEKKELEAQIAERDKKISELEAQIAEGKKQEVASFLDSAEQSGRITKEERAGFEKLAAADLDTVKEIVSKREAKPSGSLKDLQAQASSKVPEGRENWTYLKWMKEDGEGLKRMKIENPKEFERLQATLRK